MTQAIVKPTTQKPGTKKMVRKPDKISYDTFLKQNRDNQYVEWVNGKVVPMAAVTDVHEVVRIYLLKIIDEYVVIKSLGAVLGEPYNMKLGYGLPGRSPDILFVANANIARKRHNYLDGPADLVVEIISPDSVKRDRVTKFGEYEQAGVKEYWILDPRTQQADFYVRDENGKYQATTPDVNGIYHSTILKGFWLKVAWLWQPPIPITEIVRIWGL